MNAKKQREELIIAVSALYATGRGSAVGAVLRSRQAFVASERLFLEEFFIHLSLLLGFPTMIDGLENLSRISLPRSRAQKKISRLSGRALLERVYGNQTEKLLTNLRAFHPELPGWVVRDVYGKVYARKGLTLLERELCNVIVLLFQNLDKQLISHIRGVLRAGMQRSDLRKAMLLAMKVAGRRKSRALHLLRPVVSQRKKM